MSEKTKIEAKSQARDAVGLNDLLACPFCGGTEGYYEKWIQRYNDYFYFDRTHNQGGEFHVVRGGKRKYCVVCHNDITKYVNKIHKS